MFAPAQAGQFVALDFVRSYRTIDERSGGKLIHEYVAYAFDPTDNVYTGVVVTLEQLSHVRITTNSEEQ